MFRYVSCKGTKESRLTPTTVAESGLYRETPPGGSAVMLLSTRSQSREQKARKNFASEEG